VVFSFSEAARGPQGEPGSPLTVDQTIIDGSTNAVSGNAVFDGLALKAPIANPTFTGIVTAPRITGRCDGLEVLCKAGLAINAGQVVYVTGASGNNIIIGLAQANAELTSSKTIGISESTLANNATGYVITEGLLTVSISAPAATEGDPIWLSPTTAGGMVFGAANKPVAPNHMVYLGVVTRKTGNTIVEIFVKVQNGSELEELADVSITSPTAGQALMRGASLWSNRSLVAADISDSTTAGRALLTAADAAAQRTSLGLGTLATQSGTFSGTSSGTNTGDETGARIASLITAATSKTTLVDADETVLTDSAASFGLKKVTWLNVWNYIVTKIGAITSITAGGAWSFSSTTRPTSSGTGTPAATSLMTQADVAARTRATRLGANISLNNSTTPTNIITLSVVAGKKYQLQAYIVLNGTVSTGTRHGITFPAGTIRCYRLRSSSYIPVQMSGDLNLGLAETATNAEIKGFYECSTSGDIALTYAQNTSSADNITASTYTFLSLTEYD